jgi:large subunit ribosomal protein L4
MKLKLRNLQGQDIGEIDVRDDVFDVPMNQALVHQVMVGQLANARQGSAATKNRARVSGGGAKPRPQKHSGRSRQGSIRSPQWRGGGVVFGPTPRSFRQRTPKRMRRQAMLSVLSDRAREDALVVVEHLELESIKTKAMAEGLRALGAESSVLLVGDGADSAVLRCARNIPKVKMLPAALLNTVDLLNHRTLVMTLDAVRNAEETWGGPFTRHREPGVALTGEGI